MASARVALRRYTTAASADSRIRTSPLNVPLIPQALRKALFGVGGSDVGDQGQVDLPLRIERAKKHLAHHNLNLPTHIPDAMHRLISKIRLPKLAGKNIGQHFDVIGSSIAHPYKSLALELSENALPPMPAEWRVDVAGWTMYKNGRSVPVKYPQERALVFDVEVCLNGAEGVNKYPTLAVAASRDAWYSWSSTQLINMEDAEPELLSLGDIAVPRLVVGHNVSYDRARIAEEYRLQRTNINYLDTMSMHICLNGMTSGQECISKVQEREYSAKVDRVGMDIMDDQRTWEERNIFVEGTMTDVRNNVQDLFSYCARDVKATHEVYRELAPQWFSQFSDITFAGMLEMNSAYLPVNPRWDDFVQTADELFTVKMRDISVSLARIGESVLLEYSQGKIDVSQDPWLCQLDWSLPKGKLRGTHAMHLQDKPKWYRDTYKDGQLHITTRARIAPCLLRLRWAGQPLRFDLDAHSWGYVDRESGLFCKLPHSDGEGKSVGSPLSKGFLKDIDSGTLTSEFEEARKALQIAAECSYWVSTKERVKQQLVHTDPLNGFPAIIPHMVSAGTVTRRAVEATWLTASNAKTDRLGSELKAQVQAPPGYKFVGADVDSQELWIAAVFGDAYFAGLHGSTALGWMALGGTKTNRTDVHSRTAELVGIDRNTAKIFNYGRIYGAGVRFAEKLLRQHNRQITPEEAAQRAIHLYANTKGIKWYKLSDRLVKSVRDKCPECELDGNWASMDTIDQVFGRRRWAITSNLDSEWRGGTESHMFNALERIANSPNPRTPVLNCPLSQVLHKDVTEDGYLTSRVNWVVQSSAVDYLHLMLVSMRYLCNTYKIDARFSISIHDEVRYLVKEEDVDRAALALHYTNLFVRAMFAYKLGMHDLPLAVAFFEAVDIDTVLRKEVNMDCITPSQPTAIPYGRNVDMAACVLKNKTKLALPASIEHTRGPPTLLPNWDKYAPVRGSQTNAVPVLPAPQLTALVQVPVRIAKPQGRWIQA